MNTLVGGESKLLSYIAAGLISYAFFMVFFAIKLAPADFWVSVNVEKGVPNMQTAFANIFGQSNWIIVGSSGSIFDWTTG